MKAAAEYGLVLEIDGTEFDSYQCTCYIEAAEKTVKFSHHTLKNVVIGTYSLHNLEKFDVLPKKNKK